MRLFPRFRPALTLPVKTTLMLVCLLTAAVALSGGLALVRTRVLLAASGASAGEFHRLQNSILLAGIAVILLAIPVAGLVARHITVPIQNLAAAARTFASSGKLVHVHLARADELGQLADAFNQMAATLHAQQLAIISANADLERKVRERTAQLERVNRQLTDAAAEKEDFLRAVSHDLNAPLRNIDGLAAALLHKHAASLSEDAVQRLERIQKNVQHECELLGELLELSRITSCRGKIEAVDLHRLAQSVADSFASDFENRRITFRLLSRLPMMQCEKPRLRQVFQNFIDNAVKYMRDDGPRELCIACRHEFNEVILSFHDTGLGIAPSDIPLLFRVFRRAKNAAMLNIPGKGVGLASIKSIIDTYGGRLWAESTPGTETTFFVALPAHHFAASSEVAA